MHLARLLNREANNLDVFRLIAACMVIYGHAYALTPEMGQTDFVSRALGFDYSGSLAVKIFFFLSGLVVTNSLLEKRSVAQFAIDRICRIVPALFVTVTLCAMLLGPLLTRLSLDAYWGDAGTYRYIFMNTLMQTTFMLPGVFLDNPYQGNVNGSLWTIPYEACAYLIVAVLFRMGLFRSSLPPLLLFTIILMDPLTGNRLLFSGIQNPEAFYFAPCFAFGAVLAFYKDRITLKPWMLVGAWVTFFIWRGSACNFYLFYLALFGTLLYLSGMDFLVRLKRKSDFSYGIYLWGFPVQQTLAHYFGGYGIRFNQIAAMGLCLLLGCISWHLIEKRSIAFGKLFGQAIRALFSARARDTRGLG